MNDSFPQGWVTARLADIAVITMGSSPPGSSYNTTGSGVPLVNGPAEFGAGPLDKTIVKQYTTQPITLCKQGDLLLCVRGSTTGRTNIAGFDAAIGRGVAAIRALIFQPFLNHYLASQRDQIFALGTGSTFPNIRAATVVSLPVAVPPLPAQQRIVAKIEELLPNLDAGVSTLERATANLTIYRDRILRAAIDGSLTAKWRSSHSVSETGSQLLEKILIERRRHWEAEQVAKFEAAEKTPPKNWRVKYVQPKPPDTRSLPELPDTWCWTTLESIAHLVGGITKDKKRFREGTREVPYLRVANVQRGYLDLNEMKSIHASPKEIADLSLKKGDILFTEGGDRDKLGRGWIWQDELPECIHQNHIFRARLIDSTVQSKFVSHHGNTFGRDWFTTAGKQTTNLASINLESLRRFPVPIPPVQEQEQIIAEVDHHLFITDAARKQIDQEFDRATKLRKSILRQAFEGTLVSPDPTDEPASVLLERIRQERAAKAESEPGQGKGRRRKGAGNMTKQERRELFDVLKENPKGLSPEDLLRMAGYDITEVDDFYSELKTISEQIVEVRPAAARITKWPTGAKILLRAKGSSHAD